MSYPYEFETEADHRAWEARYELEQEARERRTDPVYAMRRLDERFERERDMIVASGAVRITRDAEPWNGEPYAPGDPYLLDRIESHRAPDGGFHRDY